VEFKCPTTATHIRTLLRGAADPQYLPQMGWQMACTGRTWCHFASYAPRLPEPYPLAIFRVGRFDPYIINGKEYAQFQEYIEELEDYTDAFLREVDEMVQKITRRTA
jgi:hypothetical protein